MPDFRFDINDSHDGFWGWTNEIHILRFALSFSKKTLPWGMMALAAVRSKAVVLLLLTFCLLLLQLLESVIVLCFVVRYFLFILVLQSP